MRVEVDAQAVDAAIETAAKGFQKEASLPGFRPGKAPRDMILKRYDKEILEEAKRRLIGDSYRDAVKEQKLSVVMSPDIEEVQFGRGKSLQFNVTLETAPEFELPEYKGLPAKQETTTVTEADVERAIELLRGQQATFVTVTRPIQTGDFAVLNYVGSVEGKPITDLVPTAKGLADKKGFWVQVAEGQFIPGFTEQLVGLKAGDKHTVNITFPVDFVSQPLAGKPGAYEVEVVEVKEKTLPAVDDALAKAFGAEDLTKLREGVRKDLENELTFKKRRDVRTQVVQQLLGRFTCDLPESVVAAETRNVVYDLVAENQRRGITKDILEKEKEQIYNFANSNARDRVKLSFAVQRIADKEKLQVANEDVMRRIYSMASQHNTTADKIIKELQKRNGIDDIVHQVLMDKVIDLLADNAKLEDVTPAAPEAPAPAAT